MTRISERFTWAIAALSLAAALALWQRVLDPTPNDPCGDVSRLFEAARIGDGRVTRVTPGRIAGAGVLEGETLRRGSGFRPIHFWIERTFEPSELYGADALEGLDPSFARDGGEALRSIETRTGELPVNWLEDTLGNRIRVRAHTFVVDGQPVVSPFRAGARLGWRQLVSGTRPMTMLAVRAEGTRDSAAELREAAETWVRAAWSHYRDACELP